MSHICFPASQDVIIHLKVLLINVTWDAQFGNESSDTFKHLSSVIGNSVSNIYLIIYLIAIDVFPYENDIKFHNYQQRHF